MIRLVSTYNATSSVIISQELFKFEFNLKEEIVHLMGDGIIILFYQIILTSYRLGYLYFKNYFEYSNFNKKKFIT